MCDCTEMCDYVYVHVCDYVFFSVSECDYVCVWPNVCSLCGTDDVSVSMCNCEWMCICVFVCERLNEYDPG